MHLESREEELKKLALAFCTNPRRTAGELAAAAGISKATFYRVYGSRENLSRLLSEKAREKVSFLMELVNEEKGDTKSYLRKIIRCCCANKEFLMLLCYGYATGSIDSWCQDTYTRQMTDFFLRGQKSGTFRVDIPASVMTELFAGAMWSLFEGECHGRVASASLPDYWEAFFLKGIENQSEREEEH